MSKESPTRPEIKRQHVTLWAAIVVPIVFAITVASINVLHEVDKNTTVLAEKYLIYAQVTKRNSTQIEDRLKPRMNAMERQQVEVGTKLDGYIKRQDIVNEHLANEAGSINRKLDTLIENQLRRKRDER